MGTSKKMKTIEGRESYLVDLAFKEVEKRLKAGTISSQLLTELLKLGTVRSQKALEKMETDIALSTSKIKFMESQENSEKVAREAIEALKTYRGHIEDEDIYAE